MDTAGEKYNEELQEYTSGREDFARLIAQETSGIVGAEPEDEDYELADKFLDMIEGRYNDDVL